MVPVALRYAYRDRSRSQIGKILFAFLLSVFVLPDRILSALSSREFLCLFGERGCKDYDYWVSIGNLNFAGIYSGGIILQFAICLLIIFYHWIEIVRTPGKVFAGDIFGSYILVILFLILAGGICVYFGLTSDDFSTANSKASWFQHNPAKHLRLFPQPANRLVFILTTMLFFVIVECAPTISAIFGALILGDKVTLESLNGASNDHGK